MGYEASPKRLRRVWSFVRVIPEERCSLRLVAPGALEGAAMALRSRSANAPGAD